jgi:uncharacterized membrane protein YqhA
MFHRILSRSRYIIFIAVLCSFLAALTVLFYGAAQTFNTIGQVIAEGSASSKGAKNLVLSFVEVIDLFLLATVFYITALGLYELFIDDRIHVPEWLEIHNLDDLKNRLTSVVVVLLSVLFLGRVVQWDGTSNILPFGLSIALVIAALTYFMSGKAKKTKLE